MLGKTQCDFPFEKSSLTHPMHPKRMASLQISEGGILCISYVYPFYLSMYPGKGGTPHNGLYWEGLCQASGILKGRG